MNELCPVCDSEMTCFGGGDVCDEDVLVCNACREWFTVNEWMCLKDESFEDITQEECAKSAHYIQED